jgi:hypothetical protein
MNTSATPSVDTPSDTLKNKEEQKRTAKWLPIEEPNLHVDDQHGVH